MSSMSGGDDTVYLEKRGGRQDIHCLRQGTVFAGGGVAVLTHKMFCEPSTISIFFWLLCYSIIVQARDSPTLQEVPDGQVITVALRD